MPVSIERLTLADSPVVLDLIQRLRLELGEEGEETVSLSTGRILSAWRDAGDRFMVLAARDSVTGDVVGIATLLETFAIYADGPYGVINEMYVVPGFRSSGIGATLIGEVVTQGRRRGWSRIDVTAPASDTWHRTRRFYEHQGFVFAGPKLKFSLR